MTAPEIRNRTRIALGFCFLGVSLFCSDITQESRYVFSKYKTYGWEAVKGNIEYYKNKYPSNTHLLKLLDAIHP